MNIKKHQQQPIKRDVKLGVVVIAILSLLFGLYLVNVGISAGATVLTFVAFVLFSSPLILSGNPALIKALRNDYTSKKSLNTIVVLFVAFGILVMLYAMASAQFTATFATSLVVWMALVCGILMLLKQHKSPHWSDYVFLVLLWLPLEFGLIDSISIPAVRPVVSSMMLTAMIAHLYVYLVIRGYDMGFTYRLKGEDYRVVILDFVLLFFVALIIGMLTGFLSIANYMPPFSTIVIRLATITFFVALPQELIFRGVIFKLLQKQFNRQKRAVAKAMIISSLLFGLVHFNNPIGPLTELRLGSVSLQLPLALMFISTIAGLFYCFVFIRTKKIFAAVLLHALAHWVYFVFFD